MTGVAVYASEYGIDVCVSGGATTLGASCAFSHRLWHCTAGTACLCILCNGDSMETAPQDI